MKTKKIFYSPIKLYKENKISKKHTIHMIRKTFASYLVNQGINQNLLMKLLDHSDIRVTDSFYTRLDSQILREQFKGISFIGKKKKVSYK